MVRVRYRVRLRVKVRVRVRARVKVRVRVMKYIHTPYVMKYKILVHTACKSYAATIAEFWKKKN